MKRGFVIHHNGPEANCIGRAHTRCVQFWAAVRDFHVNSNGWSDIAYSFGICPHGTRFVGRGWDKNQFAGGTDVVGTDDGPDSAWYSVLAFLGGAEKPTPLMVAGVADLIAEGRSSGRCGQRVLPHNAFKPKPCPGPEFTAYAKAWDNQQLDAPTGGGDATTPPDLEEPDMIIAQSKDTGAALLITGGTAVLVVNNTELGTHRANGIPVLPVGGEQFKRYETLRDPINEAAIGAAVGAAVAEALATLPGGSIDAAAVVAPVVAGVRSALAELKVKATVDGHFELADS